MKTLIAQSMHSCKLLAPFQRIHGNLAIILKSLLNNNKKIYVFLIFKYK